MSSLTLVHTSYHVVRDVDGKVLLSTPDFRAAKTEQIDRFIHSMPCHIDISTWHKQMSIEEQLDELVACSIEENINAHHPSHH